MFFKVIMAMLITMKNYSLPMLLMFFAGCNNQEEVKNLPEKTLLNVSYGNDSYQKADVYLPKNRDKNTKVIILVHGGGWSGGSKSDFTYFIPTLKQHFPSYAIVNTNYRLATASSPGFPKQIQDIEKLIDHLKTSNYAVSNQYALIGTSAGAHLSLLYAFKHDLARQVKAVVSIVGPADFSDPAYTSNAFFQFGLSPLVGNITPESNPEIFVEVSPAAHVSENSPPVVGFYGGQDALVPVSQGQRLKTKLDASDVYNELYIYPNGGHGNWNNTIVADFTQKLIAFLKLKF